MVKRRRPKVRLDESDLDLDETWVWCLHCERCYKISCFRRDDDTALCFYEDCDGSLDADGWLWEIMREIHPEFPIRPKWDEVYRLFKLSTKV